MFSLQTHAIICASLFFALIAVAIGGNALQAAGVIHDVGVFRTPLLILIFVLFLGFGFSAIPVMVKLVLGFQRQIGNENVEAVVAVLKAERWIVYTIWALLAAGLVVALPAAIKGGLFNPPGPENTAAVPDSTAASSKKVGPSSGTLIARPGMLLTEMVRGSSIAIDVARQSTWTGSVEGGQVFDFRLAGTNLVFADCRYYFVSPYVRDPQRIESISVGLSPSVVGVGELRRESASLRARLAGDGWLAGHEEYRDEEDRKLHVGAARGPSGTLWLKDGIVLSIGNRHMDDASLGENLASAGRWIQFVDLWARADFPNIDRYAFAPASE